MTLSSYLLESFEATFMVAGRGGFADSGWVATKQELGLTQLRKRRHYDKLKMENLDYIDKADNVNRKESRPWRKAIRIQNDRKTIKITLYLRGILGLPLFLTILLEGKNKTLEKKISGIKQMSWIQLR